MGAIKRAGGPKKAKGVSPRKASRASLKAQHAKRSKRLRVVAIGVLLLFLVGDLLPMTIGEVSPERPSSNYGVDKELAAVQDTRTSEKWANIIRSEAEGELDRIDVTHEARPPVSIEEQVVIMNPLPHQDPDIFTTIEDTTLPNRTTLIEFLINQPMSYYVYTDSNGHEKWSEGMLRPTILGFNTNGTLIDWDKWVEIDVDDDPTTGDANGFDVRVRLDIMLDGFPTFDLPQLFPYRPAQAHVSGGVRLEIEKVSGPNTKTELPLKVFITKSYSYTGNNFLWMMGCQWTDMPNQFRLTLKAADIILQRPTISLDLLNLSLLDTTNVVNIVGPYEIDFSMDTRPKDTMITVAYAKVQLTVLSERTWAVINIRPADGLDRVPEWFHLQLDSPSFNMSFDKLAWTSSAPAHLGIDFKQAVENTTSVSLLVDDIPTSLSVELNTIDGPRGTKATNVVYHANARIKKIEYTEFEFYTENFDKFSHSRIIIGDMPRSIQVNGTFEVGGPDVPPPENFALGFPARFMDNTMRKITAKFYRVAQTLRTIPNNIIHMPEKKGYTEMSVLGDEYLGSLEFFVSSKTRVEAAGNYIAFRNDSKELNLPDPDGLPLINSSLSGRFTDLKRVYLDFMNGTVLDLQLEGPRPLRVMFIDDGNDAKAVLAVNDVPASFYLKFHPDTIRIKTDEPLKELSYTSLVRQRYFRLMLEDLPTDLLIDQRGGSMKMNCAPGTSLGAFSTVVTDRDQLTVPSDDYNYIFLERSLESYFSSIMLRDIKSIDMKTSVGGLVNADFAHERDLYIDLTDSVLDIDSRLLFSPFPSNFTIELPRGFTTSGIRMPNVLGITSLFAFSPLILEMDKLAGDLLKMTTELTENLASQLSDVGTNTTIKLRSKVPTTLIADMRQGPAEDIRWVHGLNVAIDKPDKAMRAKIYLRLPLEASIKMRTIGDRMDMEIEFKDYDPIWEFLDVRVTGMADRDVSLLIDDFPKQPTDLYVKATIDANMTPGKGWIKMDISLTATSDLGPMFVYMRKSGGTKSVTTMYMSSVPRLLEVSAEVSDKVSVDWESSSGVKNVYALVQKEVRGKWYDVTLTLNKVPTKLYVRAGRSTTEPPDMDGTLLQSLPELSISGTTSSLSMYVYLEGPAMGQPQSYEIHLRGVTSDTYTVLDEDRGVYKIRSQGLGFLYLRIIDMPFTKQMQLTEAEIYADEVYSADLKVSQAFGTYPIIEVSNLDADTMQVRAKAKLEILGTLRDANLIFADVSFSGPLPRSAQLTRNGLSMKEGDSHTVVPAPIATLLATLLGGGG